MLKTVSIIITGKVQGVFFRQSTKEYANACDIKGEVKNMPDGSVHVIATGSEAQLDQLIDWCKKGPPKAIVEKVEATEIPIRHFDNFIITRK
jgi:acylphosphatase